MPKPKKGNRLGAGPSDQRKILSNLAKSLIEHGSITTTHARAKMLQPYVEKLITKAKKGDIHRRRLVARRIGTQSSKYERGFDAVYTLFDEVVPKLDPEREGGYTRIVKVGHRRGDNAPMSNISIIFDKVEKKAVVKDAEATTRKAAKKDESKDKDEVKDTEEPQGKDESKDKDDTKVASEADTTEEAKDEVSEDASGEATESETKAEA